MRSLRECGDNRRCRNRCGVYRKPCHCEGAARGNLLVFSGDNLKTKGKHRTPRPPHL